jgi:hypothetical protein
VANGRDRSTPCLATGRKIGLVFELPLDPFSPPCCIANKNHQVLVSAIVSGDR